MEFSFAFSRQNVGNFRHMTSKAGSRAYFNVTERAYQENYAVGW